MKSVYRGSNYIEAQLLTGLLEQRGISVYLQGAALQGGLGEVPAVGYLSIMVDEQDVHPAKLLLAAYERGDFAITEDDVE
jgi:Putative prokaryotic signal transducing protein